MLQALHSGSSTLAGLRAALPLDDAQATAIPSMGEDDEFGAELSDLVARGWVADADGWYALAGSELADAAPLTPDAGDARPARA